MLAAQLTNRRLRKVFLPSSAPTVRTNLTDYLRKLKDFAKAGKIMSKVKHWACQDWAWMIKERLSRKTRLLENGDQFDDEREYLKILKGPM